MAKLGEVEAEVIRQWCVSDEGQQRIHALLDELDEAVKATKSRQRELEKLWLRIPVDNRGP